MGFLKAQNILKVNAKPTVFNTIEGNKMSELKEFYVEVDFLHKPTFRTKVKAVNEAQAITRAVEVSLHPKNTMYRNDSRVITVEQRNQDIRDWRKEEAESGNI